MITLSVTKRKSYKLGRMTRGVTGETHLIALPGATGVFAFEDAPLPSVSIALIHTPVPRCVATTSNEPAKSASHLGQTCPPVVALSGTQNTHSERSVSVNKVPSSAGLSARRQAPSTPGHASAVSRNPFFCLTPARLSDNYPLLLKMFDRTQAANNLS
jgi:hypothetical protein